MSTNHPPTTTWYWRNWGTLGWLETGLKLIAIGVGVMALIIALIDGTYGSPLLDWRCQVILLGFMAFGWFFTLGDRILDREIFAVIFAVLSIVGHWSLFGALFFVPRPELALIVFCALMAIGDIVKLAFFAVHQFQVRNLPIWLPYVMTTGSLFIYLGIIYCALV